MKRILAIFFILLSSGAYWSTYSNAEPTIEMGIAPTFYFYNTETNINNFATLKMGFDIYFVNHGGYYLQPFDIRENFEKAIQDKKGDIYLLSSWHLKELQLKKVPLEIALVATSKGKIMQKKVLSVSNDITNVAMLKDTVVAAAGSEEYVHSILKQILGKKQEALLKDIKILIVPKDLDALLAVGFGMASAAISAENGLDKLAMMIPGHFRRLHTLGFSEEDYILIAATLKKPDQEETQLLKVLREMSDTEAGKENLKLLGIDGRSTLK